MSLIDFQKMATIHIAYVTAVTAECDLRKEREKMNNNEIIECLQIFLKNTEKVSNDEKAVVIMDCRPDSFKWVITCAIEALSIKPDGSL